MDKLTELKTQLEKDCEKLDFLQVVQDKTGLSKFYLVAGSFVFLVLVVLCGILDSFLTNLVGFIYPAYASFKAIESIDKEDDTQWLTYWVVFAFFSVIEYFSDRLVYWLPFYYPLKLIFLVWCLLPQTMGAELVYRYVIRRFLLANEERIDGTMHQTVDGLKQVVKGSVIVTKRVGRQAVKDAAIRAVEAEFHEEEVLVDGEEEHQQPNGTDSKKEK
ncbi:Receptor expression-enhancing protein 5 [Balamuthia mandrillaris]